ncbi:MAG: rod-binding protein [Nitrospirota bacterium]
MGTDLGYLPLHPVTTPDIGFGARAEGLVLTLEAANDPAKREKVDLPKAAKEFESYFIAYLMKVMRETVPKGLVENKGGQYFYYFYDQEIGRLAAERGGLGFGALLLGEYGQQPASSGQKNLSSPGANQPIPGASR